MGNKIGMEYLQANGRARRTNATTEERWPNFIVNHPDGQAHSLTHSPVFPLEKNPREFTEWNDLITAQPPDIEHFPDRLLCVCEDQGIWPISSYVIIPNIQDMQMQFKEFGLDAEQNGVVSAAKSTDSGDGVSKSWSYVAMGVFALVAVIIVLVVLQSKIAKDFLNDFNPLMIGL